ncbi:MAG: hypothetical protein U9N14_00705 [Pseudomonadota bacterium]|nr:hypothetical protein [Pseudomonadota bacterium]
MIGGSRIRLLPLLIAVALLALFVRTAEFLLDVDDRGSFWISSAGAQTMEMAEETPATVESQESAAVEGETAEVEDETPKNAVRIVPGRMGADFTPSEVQLLKKLAERRAELDARAETLDKHEALIKATEMRVEEKIAELNSLKGRIEVLIDQNDTEQNAKIAGLVKIYESMKPRDAARIFDKLDMSVLFEVAKKMNERKIAPIIAAMGDERARKLTAKLAEANALYAFTSK